MARHRHTAHRSGSVPTAEVGISAPPLPRGAARLGWSRWALAIWYLGGFVLLFIAALLQVGPSAWMAAWQVHHWGGDNVVVSFLPGFIVLAAPLFIVRLLPRAAEGSFLRGMQDGLSTDTRRPSTPPERMAHILLLLARGALVASGVFLLAGGLGYELVTRIGDHGAGARLPELTLLAVTTQGAALPPYARLVGAVPQPALTWLHDHSERRTYHRDAFTPLTGQGWRPQDPIALLEEDRTILGEEGTDAVLPPGPIEGALGRGTLPGWMLDELRRRGVAVTSDPVVLDRQDLHGLVPGADPVGAVLCLGFGGMFGLVALGVSFGYRYRRRRILRDLAAVRHGRVPATGHD